MPVSVSLVLLVSLLKQLSLLLSTAIDETLIALASLFYRNRSRLFDTEQREPSPLWEAAVLGYMLVKTTSKQPRERLAPAYFLLL